MKSIEKWTERNLDLIVMLIVCLIAEILIYQYQYDRRILLGVENVTPGGEVLLPLIPLIYLSITWEGRMK